MIILKTPALPNERFNVTLNGQDCTIGLAQRGDFLFFSLSVAGRSIVTNVAALNRVRLVRFNYLNFIGDFAFVDFEGKNAPRWDGLGVRYQLIYLEPGDKL